MPSRAFVRGLLTGQRKMKDTLEKIKTARFGELNVSANDVITMPEGIIGFNNAKQYVMLDFHAGIDTALKWFQAIDCPELAFVLIDPYTFRPDYKVNITNEEMDFLKAKSLDVIRVMSIVSIPCDPHKMTANLLGPVLINPENRIAMQVVLNDTEYTASHNILPQE